MSVSHSARIKNVEENWFIFEGVKNFKESSIKVVREVGGGNGIFWMLYFQQPFPYAIP